MGPLVRLGDGGSPLPEQLAVVSIEAEGFELKRWQAARELGVNRDSGRDKNLAFPDDRRGKSLSGNVDLPFDVFGRTPFERRRRLSSRPIPRWPTPMTPVVSKCEAIESYEDKGKEDGGF
jgi:hypothetical protein